MKYLVVLTLFLVACVQKPTDPNYVHMAPNGDYEYVIHKDWSIYRMNSFDKLIGKKGGGLPYTNREAGIGPIWKYAVTESAIWGQHYGSKLRNLFKGDEFMEVDQSVTCFVRIDLNTKAVVVKFDAAQIPQGLEWKVAP